jgi:membrane glycosyltransferase
MLNRSALQQDGANPLLMPDQVLSQRFTDQLAPGLANRNILKPWRLALFGLPVGFFLIIGSILFFAFRNDGQLTLSEVTLIVLMALLSAWGAFPTANALIGMSTTSKHERGRLNPSLAVAIVMTIRDENAHDVIPGKLELLRSLQTKSRHSFSLHVLSDSSGLARVEDEQRIVRAAIALPVHYHRRRLNTDFKSGNIRHWISVAGGAYDAFIILDADSEMDHESALALADALFADPACGLIQTVPVVMSGGTRWQQMQSLASRHYGRLQGQGLSAWMGDESNYYGHNAIIRTKAFAACAGLPHLMGRGLWNGSILSHDFVEAALLRRAGWAVRFLPALTGSFEQAPADVIAHLKRDERWCLGNFQHSRILSAAGLHPVSRFHLLSGMFTYLSSALWLVTLLLWGALDATQGGVGGSLAIAAFLLIAINLLMPRILGVLHATAHKPARRWRVAVTAVTETLYSSLFAPSLMVQRVMIIGRVLGNRRMVWAAHEKAQRNVLDYVVFHWPELLAGLALFASIERGLLTFWFLPLAFCLAITPALSWLSARPAKTGTHGKLNAATPL